MKNALDMWSSSAHVTNTQMYPDARNWVQPSLRIPQLCTEMLSREKHLYYTACLCKLATSHTTHAINRYVCVRPSVLSTTFQAKTAAARPRSPRWMATVWAESETDEEEEERTMNKIIQQYTQCSLLGGEGGGQDRSIVVVVGSGTGKFFFLFLLSSPYFPPTPLRT